MTRVFCDACGCETFRDYVSKRLVMEDTLGGVEVKAEVTVAVSDTWNGGNLCRSCVMAVLTKGREIVKS